MLQKPGDSYYGTNNAGNSSKLAPLVDSGSNNIGAKKQHISPLKHNALDPLQMAAPVPPHKQSLVRNARYRPGVNPSEVPSNHSHNVRSNAQDRGRALPYISQNNIGSVYMGGRSNHHGYHGGKHMNNDYHVDYQHLQQQQPQRGRVRHGRRAIL